MTQRTLDTLAEGPAAAERWDATECWWPDDDARVWTSSAVAKARDDEAIQAIVAAGSAVRNVDHCDDLDLVLVYLQRHPQLSQPPISIDLGQYECADVPVKLAAGHDYLCWAVRFGRVLYERDNWWLRLRVEWNSRLPLPSVADARDRARTAERLSKELAEAGDVWAAAELRLSMLTQLARAELSNAGIFPKSRPELAGQLRSIGEAKLAKQLARAMAFRNAKRNLRGWRAAL